MNTVIKTEEIPLPINSFWVTKIPKVVTLASNTELLVDEFLRQFKTYYGTVNIATDTFTNTHFIADKNTPLVNVTEVATSNESLKKQFTNVSIPLIAVPSPDPIKSSPDYGLTIYNKDTDTFWEFWKMQKVLGKWQAQWGGKIEHYTKSNGVFPYPFGMTATGLSGAAGQITAEELTRGIIEHVIGISVVDAEEHTIFSWPATRSDGHNPAKLPNRIMEGQRFRLDPTIDVNTLKLSPVGKIIAKAAQDYGFIVTNRSGAIAIAAKNSSSYTALGLHNPYPALFANKGNWSILQNFPWDKLQFLPKDYGKH